MPFGLYILFRCDVSKYIAGFDFVDSRFWHETEIWVARISSASVHITDNRKTSSQDRFGRIADQVNFSARAAMANGC